MMMRTDLIFHEMFLKHEMSYGHPESPERLRSAMKAITDAGLLETKLNLVEPIVPDLGLIQSLHDKEYLDGIRRKSETGGGYYTMDTSVNSYTYEAALLAAGGGIQAVDRVMRRESKNALVLCRPPGHHAEFSRAFGFCFINNIAVAARHLLEEHNLDRIMIVDYDAHHGNGTQDAFYYNKNVFYVGMHQDGRSLFPGSGFSNETGEGDGLGYTANLAMYPGAGDASYKMGFTEIIEPLAESFKPQFLLVSVGYDAHYRDPLTNLGLTSSGFAFMNERLREIARLHANDRLVCFLEGGYNLDAMAMGALNLVQCLSGESITAFSDNNHSESDTPLKYTESLVKALTESMPLLR
jgi:acetoin utilization deacetylase AcuC-like enzyme